MGLGDQLIATGFARGAQAGGKRIAFGDGRRILWDHNSEQIFRGNPNVAGPGSEGSADLEWVPYYKGHRIYNSHDRAANRWIWNYDFRPTPGDMFFARHEIAEGQRYGSGFIVIEPHVEAWKSVAPNKDWGRANYQAVADRLIADGHHLIQFVYDKGSAPLAGVEAVTTRTFREALAVLANSAAYIGPEGGLHHGAAAVGIPAVVMFGGFVPPSVTGYDTHINLTGGAEACGSINPCEHCRKAMQAITVEDVTEAARKVLHG